MPIRDPVRWRKREHNAAADYSANYPMDIAFSWQHEWHDLDSSDWQEGNIVLHSDGGMRSPGCAAAAWIMGAHVLTPHGWEVHLLMAKGIYITHPI
eukprot:11291190-Karenia_brevis.AAC.1